VRGTNAWVCVDTDSKREFVAVSAVCPVNPTVALVTIVTTSHVTIQLVTHVPIGQDGPNGDNAPPLAALASEENKELAMERILKKVKIMDLKKSVFRNLLSLRFFKIFGFFKIFLFFQTFDLFDILEFEVGFPVVDSNRR